MRALITYKGYTLEESPMGYRSKIDGEILRFDTAGQWKQYIDKNEGKKTSNRY